MKLHAPPTCTFLAALIGAVHTYLLILAWAYIGIHTLLPHWLISHGVTGAPFMGVLFSADFLINVALCAPAAYLLCKLRPAKLWMYLVVAILPSLLWQYRLVFVDTTILGNWRWFLPGVLLSVLPLPISALLIRRFVTEAPNSSSKPAPLRGAA